MRVLVTRPRHQSEHLIQALESQGHTADLFPLLEIQPLAYSDEQQKSLLSLLADAEKIIAVSANAAQLVLPLLATMETPLGKPLFGIGPGTARVLEQQGYSVKIPEDEYNSESLLALPEFSDIERQKVVMLCGMGGRDYLQQNLVERGAEVERLELYRRIPLPNNQIDQSLLAEPEVLTAMSGDTVEALNSVLKQSGLEAWKSKPLIVPGRRVADIASDCGFSQVLSSTKPTTESLMQVLGSL